MFSLSIASFGQSKFEKAMLVNIDSLYLSLQTDTEIKTISIIDNIVKTADNRWEPLYYAAYGYCRLSLSEKNDSIKDEYCDRGQVFLTKALSLAPEESELYVLQGFLDNMRLIVNPMMRGMKYMNMIEESYKTAEKLDSLNPRTYYMRAQFVLNTPTFMGGGKENALPLFQKAIQKFDTFTSVNILAPRWGKENCLKMIAECSNK